jgi:hypothetical protein
MPPHNMIYDASNLGYSWNAEHRRVLVSGLPGIPNPGSRCTVRASEELGIGLPGTFGKDQRRLGIPATLRDWLQAGRVSSGARPQTSCIAKRGEHTEHD